MTLDPRTPVLVGVGQVLNHPENPSGAHDLVDPLDLMVQALSAAAADIDGVNPGDPCPLGTTMLSKIDRLAAVVSFTWRTTNPALLVAERLGIKPTELMVTATGGSIPQKFVADAATAILRGDVDVVALVGSEAMYSRSLSRRFPEWNSPEWEVQDPSTTPAPQLFGKELEGLSSLEIERGIMMPIHIYPLFENARRARNGWTIAEHLEQTGAFWATFSAQAAKNPHAWIQTAKTSSEITTPTPQNRMIAEPYTKYMVANLPVDMGAAVIMCSYATAKEVGVRDDAMVFPHSHAQGDDPLHISNRKQFDRSIAIEFAGQRALEAAGVTIDEIDHVDLYSCFPIAAIMGAEALGLPLNDPNRLLSVTGGLTFGGGPGNNYVTQSIAAMVQRLREHPGDLGLVTGLSWFATSHAVGIYSTTPPATPFRAIDVQDEVDQFPSAEVAPTLDGVVSVETYTIIHDRDGPSKIIAALKDASGTRSWGVIDDPTIARTLSGTELIGRQGTMNADGVLTLH